jgi:hypothetical protein
MVCHVVTIAFFAWGTVVSKLASTFSVAEPMVFHIHCFQFFDDIVVDNAKCSGLCWRSLLSILVLILTLVSAGRPVRVAESV